MLRAPNGFGGIDVDHASGLEPVEELPDGG
jgi:hypothetical protein